MKRILVIAAAVFFLATPARSQNVGSAAPEFSFQALDGSQITLSDYSGKVVFVFLFGNLCPFCLAVGNRTEVEVNAIYGSNPSFQALGLDLWTLSSSTATVTAFKARTGITYPLALHAGVMASLYSTTYDRILVIGPDGVLRFKGSSVVSQTLDAAKEVVADLLAQIATDTEDLPPAAFALDQNYPNPFSSRTEIGIQLDVAGPARLVVHDLLGREVSVLTQGYHEIGKYSFLWSPPEGTPPGMYFYTLETTQSRETRSLMVLR